jgi:simple sugar transport system permease protein
LWDGTRLNASVLVSAALAAAGWVFMLRGFAAFQMRVSGLAPAAARFAGYEPNRSVWIALLLSGGAAGFAGVAEVAGPLGQLQPAVSPGYGFAAIIVAFLGRLRPLGVAAASLLLALIYLGGEAAQVQLQLPAAVAGMFQGLLLFFLLGCEVFGRYRLRWGRRL